MNISLIDIESAKEFFLFQQHFNKHEFCDKDLFTSAHSDGVRVRRKFYVNPKAREEVIANAYDIIDKYKAQFDSHDYPENFHVEILLDFQADYIRRNKNLLASSDVFVFGQAQKIINIYLKNRWIIHSEPSPRPVHIPIDSIIAGCVGESYSWTKNNSHEDYDKVMKKCKEASSLYGLGLNEWELIYWNMHVLTAKVLKNNQNS